MATPAASFGDARFRNINRDYGLPSSTVYDILQDRSGYIWLASGNGLERYDGYGFTVFKHKPNQPISIASDFVKALYQDSSGRLWVGTYGGGLDLYQPSTGTFVHYRHDNHDPNSPSSDKIFALLGDNQGNLLIGTSDGGLDIYNPESKHWRHLNTVSNPSLSDNRIKAIYIDKQGVIWLATGHGLDELDLAHNLIHAYFNAGGKSATNDIYGITEDAQGELLLATAQGLHAFLPGKDVFDQSKTLNSIPEGLEDKTTNAVFTDSKGNTWFNTYGIGLSEIESGSRAYTSFKPNPSGPEGSASQIVYTVYEDRGGLIWCGSNFGAERLDPRMLSLAYITPYEIDGGFLSAGNYVEETLADGDSTLVTTNKGMYKIRPGSLGYQNARISPLAHFDTVKYGVATSLQHRDNGELLVGTNQLYVLDMGKNGQLISPWRIGKEFNMPAVAIRGIVQAAKDDFYLATFGDGLLEYHPGSGTTTQIYGNSSANLSKNDEVETLLQINPHKMLAGTFRGLYEVDLGDKSTQLISLWKNATEPVIQGLYRDSHENVWVGTYEGLWRLRFDADGHLLEEKNYPQISGSTNVQVLAIESDKHGNLWLASNNTIMRFNPDTGNLLTLGREQDMPSLEYYSYNHSATADGWIWFGGPSGILGLNPNLVKPNTDAPTALINDITTYEEDKPVVVRAPDSGGLKLSYRDSIITFDVSATDYAVPGANTYSYRLIGFRSEWTPPSTNHLITFTNLNPGRYRLEVKASNNWGTWSTEATAMDIVVMPPWWRTWWAYTLYLFVIIGSSIAYVYSLKRKIEREQEISTNLREANDIKSNFVEKLESQVRKATHELRETLQGVNLKNAELEIAQKRAAEAEQIKSQFLANMSHELRTPLTGVLGYTKLLGSTHLNSEQKDYVGTIKQSSETLLAIINDTLDLSRLEAGKLLIDQVDFDLLEVIESTLELLAPTAYQKRLELVRVVPADVPLYLRGDPLRLRQILTNLLSNAIKFTEHGSVAIEIKTLFDDEREAKLRFTVSDTGIGIPSGELSKLFHAYARSRISTQHHVEGTGLGLAICKKLLDLMGGDIKVTSKVGTGTSFDFELVFKLQKNAEPRSRMLRKIKVLLYDAHPLSNQAWRACLMRLGAEVETVPNLESVVSLKADAAIMVLSEKELAQLGDIKRRLTPALPPMLILAPRIERQALKDLSETLFHRVLSKTAREKTLYLELQSLLQTVVHDSDAIPRQAPTPTEPAADAPKILVADDNRINRRLLVTMLNHAGFRVSEAANGLELLDLVAKGPWDAALLDIHMPGMDGIETARRLRESLGDSLPPIIAMSADVMPETRTQVLEGLMDDFMVKPFSEQELVDKLRWHLDRYSRKRRSIIQDS